LKLRELLMRNLAKVLVWSLRFMVSGRQKTGAWAQLVCSGSSRSGFAESNHCSHMDAAAQAKAKPCSGNAGRAADHDNADTREKAGKVE